MKTAAAAPIRSLRVPGHCGGEAGQKHRQHILAFLFTFPLYWIVTGAFKNGADINATKPIWVPTEWVMNNFDKLMKQRSVPLWE